jgi:hypothetical protein
LPGATLEEWMRLVHASIARVLAARLDSCGSREAAPLAKQLAAAVSELERSDSKPDRIDELVARHRARRLTLEPRDNGR